MKHGIAPHEGKELALMLSGQKQVALFTDFIPKDFVPYLYHQFDIKTLFVTIHDEYALPSFIIFVPHAHAQAEQLTQLLTPELLRLDETHRQIGRILGYEEWQIDAFLNQ